MYQKRQTEALQDLEELPALHELLDQVFWWSLFCDYYCYYYYDDDDWVYFVVVVFVASLFVHVFFCLDIVYVCVFEYCLLRVFYCY